MIRAIVGRVRLSTWLEFAKTRPFCTVHDTSKPAGGNNNNNSSDKMESSVTKYSEAYQQLDNLDFMTAAKILFSDPPKEKKFGLDFHLVQLFFACLPSLAVYLVAQYARHEMRKMDAELEQKKKQEEEKAKELELIGAKEKEAQANPGLLEVKERLDKLEEAIKDIVVESKKQFGDSQTKNREDRDDKKKTASSEPGNSQSKSGSRNSDENDQLSKSKSMEVRPGLDRGKVNESRPVSGAYLEPQKGKTEIGGSSHDAKR